MQNESKQRVPEWAQLVLAIVAISGGIIGTYIAQEISKAEMAKDIMQHTREISEIKSIVRDMPILTERVTQLYNQNERSLVVFERLANSVDTLSTNVARLDERMRALENN